MNSKFKILFLGIIISISILFAQNRDYKKEFNELIENCKNENEYYSSIKVYFNNLDDIQLTEALGDITLDMNYHSIIHLLGTVLPRFNDKIFIDNILNEIANENKSKSFKIATIELVEDVVVENNEYQELEKYNEIMFNIMQNKKLDIELRAYTAARIGYYKDYEKNKKMLTDLLNDESVLVKNNISISIRKMYEQDSSQKEREYWANLLISNIDKNSDINKYKSMLISIGNSNTDIAKNYLLELLKKDRTNETILSALKYYDDENTFKEIFDLYLTDIENIDYATELSLSEIVKYNKTNILKLSDSKENIEQLRFLCAIRLLKENKYDIQLVDKVKSLLYMPSETIRFNAVKTLHFMLPHEDEKIIFTEILKNEKSDLVQNLIYSYIGIINHE